MRARLWEAAGPSSDGSRRADFIGRGRPCSPRSIPVNTGLKKPRRRGFPIAGPTGANAVDRKTSAAHFRGMPGPDARSSLSPGARDEPIDGFRGETPARDLRRGGDRPGARAARRRRLRTAVSDLARVRAADLSRHPPEQGSTGGLRPPLWRTRVRAGRDQQRAIRWQRAGRERQRRRHQGTQGQHGLALRQHLHAGAGQGRGVHRPCGAVLGRGNRLGRHAGRARCARARQCARASPG